MNRVRGRFMGRVGVVLGVDVGVVVVLGLGLG